MKAVTDSGPTEPNQEKPQAIENLFSLMKALSEHETVQFFEDSYNACSIRYGDMKKQLAEDMVLFIQPISDKIEAFGKDEQFLKKVTREGKEKAQESAIKTMKEARELIGINFWSDHN